MDIQDVLPQDSIPSIDEPSFGASYFGDDDDDVIVVGSDPPRAYPVRILSYHEIVNDVLDGSFHSGTFTSSDASDEQLPIAVTWCPICASGIVYVRAAGGQVLTFGTSGKLADDALVMYDQETESEWKQPLGEAITGPLDGESLPVVPASMMSWHQFREAYPDGIVLQPVYGGERDPREGSPKTAYDMTPYERYESKEAFGLRAMRGEGPERTWDRDDLSAKTTVLGIVHDGDAVGYPLPVIQSEGGVVSDSVGGRSVLIVSSGDNIHAFAHPSGQFEFRDETLYGDGVSWNLATGESSDGRQLTRLPARRLYAFAWQDDRGRDSFYGLD